MNAGYSMRLKIAILLLVILALFSNFKMLKEAITAGLLPLRMSGSMFFEKRFDAVRKELPSRGTIGYITDTDSGDNLKRSAEYFMTQYVLAPVIVADSVAEYSVIIGNFHVNSPDSDFINANRLRVIKNFGQGILLLERNKE